MPERMTTAIQGVELFRFQRFQDPRGELSEVFRASWFPGERRWVQGNISRSRAGVLRGLHWHRHQTDYWLVLEGSLWVALVDLRPESATHRQPLCLELEAGEPQGIVIPPGVLHGYRVARDVMMMYWMDQEYNGTDEYGVRWNDPALNLPESWYQGPPPMLSARDANAPLSPRD
jgi:dTDP-4-dehydrorhamnose 3,5-epimerase